jgi:hypothetical protein
MFQNNLGTQRNWTLKLTKLIPNPGGLTKVGANISYKISLKSVRWLDDFFLWMGRYDENAFQNFLIFRKKNSWA